MCNYKPSFYISIFIITIIIVAYSFNFRSKLSLNLVNYTSKSRELDSMNKVKKIILYWDIYFNVKWGAVFYADSPLQLKAAGCQVWNCHFTYDKRFIGTADAVIFNPNSYKQFFQQVRQNDKEIWIWVEREAPISVLAVGRETLIASENFTENFNWTMTYHRSSDLPFIHGFFLPKNTSVMPLGSKILNSDDDLMNEYMNYLSTDDQEKYYINQKELLFQRPKLVAWLVSHCVTFSRREDYVLELQKYIPVDIYGECGNLSCLPRSAGSSNCWENIMRPQYLFYLSMENSLCDDYITEKVFNPLIYGLVPIVWGGANYSEILPPHSFIDARQYSPKNLSQLLIRLQKNTTEYQKYHKWRSFWDVYRGPRFCDLCYKLHSGYHKSMNDLTNHKLYKRLGEWRNATEKCVKVPKGKWKDYLYK